MHLVYYSEWNLYVNRGFGLFCPGCEPINDVIDGISSIRGPQTELSIGAIALQAIDTRCSSADTLAANNASSRKRLKVSLAVEGRPFFII